MKTAELKRWRDQGSVGNTSQERPTVGRQRIHYPDPDTPDGQWAWWLHYHMPEDATGKELGEGTGANRTAGFKWLAGEHVPPIRRWPAIARWLGLPPVWLSLVPPPEFCAYVKRYRRLPPDDRFKSR